MIDHEELAGIRQVADSTYLALVTRQQSKVLGCEAVASHPAFTSPSLHLHRVSVTPAFVASFRAGLAFGLDVRAIDLVALPVHARVEIVKRQGLSTVIASLGLWHGDAIALGYRHQRRPLLRA